MLEHLVDPLSCLREAYRMLRPGGVLVATGPNPIWDDIAGRLGMVADEHHEQRLHRDDLIRLVEEAGFDAHERVVGWVDGKGTCG